MGLYLGNNSIKSLDVAIIGKTPINAQTKNIEPIESIQNIIPDPTYDYLSQVTINAIPNNYIGSAINQYSDTGNVTLDENTNSKSFAAGYYANAHGAEHNVIDIPNPLITVDAMGLITAETSWIKGFTNNDSISNTSQLSTQSAVNIIPTKSQQTAVAAQKYTVGNVIVEPIPAEYITTTDANATAAEIVNTKTAYVNGVKVTGTLVTQRYYTGSSEPSSSLGNNGDLYLMVEA